MLWLLLAAGYAALLLVALGAARAARAAPPPPPPGRTVVLFDGHCQFCPTQVNTLRRLSGAIDVTDFQQTGALALFPGATHDACMRAMQLVTPRGRVFAGFEAVVHAVATRRPL